MRLGVPVYTSHTIVSANPGLEGTVESVTIARVDAKFQPIIGTERSYSCDTVLVAVGLDPVNEFYLKAKEFGMAAFAAGDAEEIAEASAAMFSGKIKGLEIAAALGHDAGEVPPDWYHTAEVLKSKPGKTSEETVPGAKGGVFPIFHCVQESPATRARLSAHKTPSPSTQMISARCRASLPSSWANSASAARSA